MSDRQDLHKTVVAIVDDLQASPRGVRLAERRFEAWRARLQSQRGDTLVFQHLLIPSLRLYKTGNGIAAMQLLALALIGLNFRDGSAVFAGASGSIEDAQAFARTPKGKRLLESAQDAPKAPPPAPTSATASGVGLRRPAPGKK